MPNGPRRITIISVSTAPDMSRGSTVASGASSRETVMAKGHMRVPKEKKKPKADKGNPKQVSAYKASLGTPKK